MDFILPSDDTMELMREEFAKLKTDSYARAFALANSDSANADADNDLKETDGSPHGEVRKVQADEACGVYIGSAATRVLLLLYFVKHLGYNISYGTQIFNTHRGLEQIRPNKSNFGQLNDLD